MIINEMLLYEPYGLTANGAIEGAKNLLGENIPYRIEVLADGTSKVHLGAHFLVTVGEALDSNILGGMGKEEMAFWFEYTSYRKDMEDGVRDENVQDITVVQTPTTLRELALKTLAEWVTARSV